MIFSLRTETEADRSRIATLLAKTYLQNGVEAIDLANTLRTQENAQKDLFIVAEEGNKIVASAMFQPVKIGGASGAAMLSLFAFDTSDDIDVDAFLEQAIGQLKVQGFSYVIIEADPEEYENKGFETCQSVGIDTGKNTFLIKPLSGEGIDLSGVLEIP